MIGLSILVMSFAFFLVFIVYVYDVREISDGTSRGAGPAQQQPTRLMPVLPPADQPLRAPDAPSSAAAPSSIPETAQQR